MRRTFLLVLVCAGIVAHAVPAADVATNQVLFVCTGNYYRSRFAQAYFNHKAQAAGLPWKAVSRGLRIEPGRDGVSPLTRQELARRAVPADLSQGDPRSLTADDLSNSDYVVILDETEHRPMMEARFPNPPAGKIHYWRIPDVPKCDAPTACQAMAKAIDQLLPLLPELPEPAHPVAPRKNIVPLDRKFADQAAALAKRGFDFDRIFAELCQTLIGETEKNPKLPIEDAARSMFGGLWLWARNGGSPRFQGQNDKAQHFIGGGAFEGYWDAGRRAAVTKERMDMHDPDNYFDLDDMAATMMGARWMDLAGAEDPAQARRWVELWATGRYSLSRSLPRLHWGHMPPHADASAESIRAVRAEIDAAITLPPPPPGTPANQAGGLTKVP
jgi:protein-tyrosine phosphatase